MLVIRPDQMETLDQESLARFVERAALHLRDRCPEETAALSDDALRARIYEDVDRAEMHCVDDETDVVRFLEFSMRHGPRFDKELDWARDILTRPHRNGTKKMDELDDHELFMIALASPTEDGA